MKNRKEKDMSNINKKPPVYDPVQVQPLKDELFFIGFEEVDSPELLDEILSAKNDQTVLMVVNSVCGCAAGGARPGVSLALQNNIIPDRLITAFAGQERETIEHLREKYLSSFPPSSPCVALFKNGELKYFMQRHQIEGFAPEDIAAELMNVFDTHCSRKGPSIPAEKYAEMIHRKVCGHDYSMN